MTGPERQRAGALGIRLSGSAIPCHLLTSTAVPSKATASAVHWASNIGYRARKPPRSKCGVRQGELLGDRPLLQPARYLVGQPSADYFHRIQPLDEHQVRQQRVRPADMSNSDTSKMSAYRFPRGSPGAAAAAALAFVENMLVEVGSGSAVDTCLGGDRRRAR